MIELRFHPREKERLVTIGENSIENMAYITLGQAPFLDSELYDVRTLSFYYEENLGYCGCPYLPSVGYHANDIEYVSIYTKYNHPSWVYFSAHSHGQGQWKLLSECEHNSEGDLVVYVALNSHACYPHKGIYWRVLGTANDLCSAKGEHLRMPAERFIFSYDYTFPNGIRLYKNLRPPPAAKSITSWERFFLPLFVTKLRNSPSVDAVNNC